MVVSGRLCQRPTQALVEVTETPLMSVPVNSFPARSTAKPKQANNLPETQESSLGMSVAVAERAKQKMLAEFRASGLAA